MPFVRRTRATFRSAEFGFFGVRVMTCRHTPRRCGAPRPSLVVCRRVFSVRRSAGALTFLMAGFRPLRTSWLMVGNENLAFVLALMNVGMVASDRSPRRSVRRPILGLPRGAGKGPHTKASRTRDTDDGVYGRADPSVNRAWRRRPRGRPLAIGRSGEASGLGAGLLGLGLWLLFAELLEDLLL